MRSSATITCRRCNNRRRLEARGLCSACYTTATRGGQLADYPRTYWRTADLLEEHDFLARQGMSLDEIADRLGLKPHTVYDAVTRRRAA